MKCSYALFSFSCPAAVTATPGSAASVPGGPARRFLWVAGPGGCSPVLPPPRSHRHVPARFPAGRLVPEPWFRTGLAQSAALSGEGEAPAAAQVLAQRLTALKGWSIRVWWKQSWGLSVQHHLLTEMGSAWIPSWIFFFSSKYKLTYGVARSVTEMGTQFGCAKGGILHFRFPQNICIAENAVCSN